MAFRYVVLALVMLAACTDYITRNNITVAIVSMVRHPNTTAGKVLHDVCPIPIDKLIANDLNANASLTVRKMTAEQYDWSPSDQGIVLGAFFYSYVIMLIPTARLAEIFGAKWIIAFGIFGSALINLITPVVAHSLIMLTMLRVVLGLVQGGIFPACFALIYQWFPQSQRSIGFGLLDVGINMGLVVSAPLSGALSEHGFAGGWPSAFYVSGIIGVVVFAIFALLVKSTPEEHKWVSQAELDCIRETKGAASDAPKAKPPVPWLAILTSLPVLTAIVARFSLGWTYLLLQSKVPTYLNDILHVPPTMNGVLNAMMYITAIVPLASAGYLSELIIKRNILSRTNTRKVFAGLTRIGMCLALVLIPAAGCNETAVISLLIVAMFSYGLSAGGDIPVPAELSSNFPTTLLGVINTISASAGFIVPYFVGVVLESMDDVKAAWSLIFYLSAALSALCGVVFVCFASADIQPWDDAKSFSYVAPPLWSKWIMRRSPTQIGQTHVMTPPS